ncbi:MAG: hypothetical protein E6G26_05870 [Actinobacteria bacterium]|nr:MAG: hypothetical protein E6G26_05870 [Actinomycetota bacterium]
MSGDVLWAEAPDDDGGEQAPEPEDQGDLDETFAARRLRRWIKGMFGGKPAAAEPEDQPGREPDA